jgi:hypothetical protein
MHWAVHVCSLSMCILQYMWFGMSNFQFNTCRIWIRLNNTVGFSSFYNYVTNSKHFSRLLLPLCTSNETGFLDSFENKTPLYLLDSKIIGLKVLCDVRKLSMTDSEL